MVRASRPREADGKRVLDQHVGEVHECIVLAPDEFIVGREGLVFGKDNVAINSARTIFQYLDAKLTPLVRDPTK
ncbi:hypothetical protein D9M71_632160 [compost metagenome]